MRTLQKTAPIITRSVTSVPRKFSIKAYSPTPGNQGMQPSCVGWASAYGARTIANAIKNNWKYNTTKNQSETHILQLLYTT